VTGPDRVAAPPAPPATASLASALPRRTAADAHGPASGGAAPPAHPGRSESAGGTPDPHGMSGRLVDVFA
jgi:hypothetical protein